MNLNPKYRLWLAALLIVACLSNCGTGSGRNNKSDASGVFEATEVVVSAQASGAIMEFNLREGTLLQADMRVGYIDTIPLHLKKLQLSANIRALESRKTDIPQQTAAIKEQIATQKRELQRFESLVGANAANQKQVDDIKSSISVLEKQLSAQIQLLQKSNQSLEQERQALEIQIEQITDQITKSIITSPIQGTVLAKYTERGEVATPGRPLFKIADMERIYLRAYIASDQLSQLKLGQKVTVLADFGERESKEYDGFVSWVSEQAEFTPKNIQTRNERDNLVYAVKIVVQNDGYLKIGMYGEVRF
ncbi:MAG: HlyD family efflux transporter periplasmic adaptor subunit [Bacteroidales bacterium]|nr:HlyD family efflux transporter periplasmic adaptor subunit [Bacteroidales bacterium]